MHKITESKSAREFSNRFHVGKCPGCGKLRFRTKRAAKEWIKQGTDYSMKPYKCGDYFHVGHQPERLRQGKITRSMLRKKSA